MLVVNSETAHLRYWLQGQFVTVQKLADIATLPSPNLQETQHLGNIVPIISFNPHTTTMAGYLQLLERGKENPKKVKDKGQAC